MRTILACVLVLGASPSFAAIAALSVLEVRSVGADTNGGGFVTGASGTDMSLFTNKNQAACTSCQSATVNISTTDGVTAGTTTITSLSGNYSSALIGNIVLISGGTGSVTAVWKQVITVPGATSFTVDTSTGLTAGTGVTVNIGGALASPGQAAAIAIGGNYIYVKNDGTYSITSASTNVAAGTPSLTAGVTMIGYSSTRTPINTDSAPTLQLNVSTATMFTGTSNTLVANFVADGNSQTAAKALSAGVYWKILFKNFNTASSGSAVAIQCQATTNSASPFGTSATGYNLEAYANTATPIVGTCINCISSNNTGASTDGVALATNLACINCISVGNDRDGFSLSGGNGGQLINCHSESNVRHGYLNVTSNNKILINNSCYGNADCITDTSVTPVELGTITVTVGSVFTSAAGHDYSLNNLVNQGALLRAAGYPALMPRGLTVNYRDIGAAQHQDTPKGSATP